MSKDHPFDAVMAPLRAYKWQELPPSEQRVLFTQLTEMLLAMMKQDHLPDGRYRITNADRARRTGENEDKLALLHSAFGTLYFEMLDPEQYRELRSFFKMSSHMLDEMTALEE
jgi:hypothetical protein